MVFRREATRANAVNEYTDKEKCNMFQSTMIGRPVEELSTPSLLLDATVFEENIRKMMEYVGSKGVSLRPHAKTHKSPMIGHQQIRSGAIGLCCATVAEAEAMVYSGLDHILITSQVTGTDKVRRTAALSRYADVMAAVDSEENVAELSRAASAGGTTLGVIIEVDVGMGRCGVRTAEDAIRLAKAATAADGLVFRGVMGYEGHAVFIGDRAERSSAGTKANLELVEVAEAIRQAGIPVEIVSAAGTGTFDIAAENPGITELQTGSYIFMDLTYAKLDIPFEFALTVLATVISRPEPGTIILDCGMKSISAEREPPKALDASGIEIAKLSEEHTIGSVRSGSPADGLRSGQTVRLIPSHCCTTVNLHDRIHVIRNGTVEAVWAVEARGIH